MPGPGGNHVGFDARVEFDPDAAWNERKRVYETSNLIIGSTSMAYAEGDASGRWTCAVAAAVFRFT
jgi:arginine decarboxylase